MHNESMTGEFFEGLTRTVLTKTGSGGSCLAGDGTVMEAACSSYNLIKQEAAQQALEAAQKKVDPTNEATVIKPMLDQSVRVTGESVGEMLLDAGYFND